MRILVTGGAGFIGSHIIEYHLNKGDSVYAVDDLSSGSIKNIAPFLKNPNFQFEKADILVWSELEVAAAWAERIYHMAAIVGVYKVLADPVRVMAINVAACERLLRAAVSGGSFPRILLASSSEVYGHSNNHSFHENDPISLESGTHSRWNYAISKLADEALGLAYIENKNLPITLVRFFNIIGPRQTGRYGMVVPRFLEQAYYEKPITVFGDGNQTRSFCDVRDVICALDKLANNILSIGEIVNLGFDQEISIKNLALLIKEISGSRSPLHFISYKEAYGQEFIDIKHRRPNLEKFNRLTHYQYQWSLEKSIDDLFNKIKLENLTWQPFHF